MSTLILGCGYLGQRVGQFLASRGENVFGTTRTEARSGILRESGIEPVVADVLDPGSLAKLPDSDRVLYCVGFDRSAGIPMRTVYVEGLRNSLRQLAGRSGHLVYAGSTGVYGQDGGGWVDEESPTEPPHESGRVCLEAETLLRGGDESPLFPAVVLRFSGMYGPGRIPRRALLARGEPIAGDPGKYLNLIHIDDAVQSAVAALERGTSGRVYLATDDRPVMRGEFYRLVAENLGVPAPCFVTPIEGSAQAHREEANKRITNRRLRTELGVALKFPDVKRGVPAALAEESRS